MLTAASKKLLAALEGNWQAEMEGFHTYTTLANAEADGARRAALLTIADAEKAHADRWAERIAQLGGPQPTYAGDSGPELVERSGGSELVLRRLEIDESRDIAKYGKQLRTLGDEASVAILHDVIADEREHYRTLGTLVRSGPPLAPLTKEQAQAALDDLLAARDERGRKASGWISDAVYGANDGLGSIFGIVSGVSGATLGDSRFVLIAGLTGMIASALSMGSGAYLAAKSEREIYDAEYAREREAVEDNEAEARELLALSYQIRGLSREYAERFVDHLAQDKAVLVSSLARERLDTTEDGLRKPLVAATSGALSTAAGALIPIVPFFFLQGVTAIVVAAVVSILAHFAVGAAKSLLTIRTWWSSGLEMTAVGVLEGVVTYGAGMALAGIGGGR